MSAPFWVILGVLAAIAVSRILWGVFNAGYKLGRSDGYDLGFWTAMEQLADDDEDSEILKQWLGGSE